MIATRVECPKCKGTHFQRIGDAVQVAQEPKGVKESRSGAIYGCLRCTQSFAVTGADVIVPDPSLKFPKAQAPPPTPRQTRNPDRDVLFSPNGMA